MGFLVLGITDAKDYVYLNDTKSRLEIKIAAYVQDGLVRLAIDAPQHICIQRSRVRNRDERKAELPQKDREVSR